VAARPRPGQENAFWARGAAAPGPESVSCPGLRPQAQEKAPKEYKRWALFSCGRGLWPERPSCPCLWTHPGLFFVSLPRIVSTVQDMNRRNTQGIRTVLALRADDSSILECERLSHGHAARAALKRRSSAMPVGASVLVSCPWRSARKRLGARDKDNQRAAAATKTRPCSA
jgi:hypothetical protein